MSKFERITYDEPRYYRDFAMALIEHYALLFRHLGEARDLSPKEWLLSRLTALAALQRNEASRGEPSCIALSQ